MAPYQRKYVKKYAKNNYNPIARRVNVYGTAGMQLAKDVAYLATLINSEPKWHPVSASNNFSWSGGVVDLSAIPNGDTSYNRDGQTVLPRFLSVKGSVKKATTGTASQSTYRMMIFRYWGEDSGASPPVAPSPADVLRTTGTQYAPYALLNRDNVGARGDRTRRIEVLRSECFTLDKVSQTFKDFSYNLEMNGTKVKNKEHIKFEGPATETPISGGIYILFITDDNNALDHSFYFTTNLTFHDN